MEELRNIEPVLNVGITKDGIKFMIVTNVKNEQEETEFRREIVKSIEKELLEIDRILKGGEVKVEGQVSKKTDLVRNIERRLMEMKEILKRR